MQGCWYCNPDHIDQFFFNLCNCKSTNQITQIIFSSEVCHNFPVLIVVLIQKWWFATTSACMPFFFYIFSKVLCSGSWTLCHGPVHACMLLLLYYLSSDAAAAICELLLLVVILSSDAAATCDLLKWPLSPEMLINFRFGWEWGTPRSRKLAKVMPNFLDLEGARFSTETKINQNL